MYGSTLFNDVVFWLSIVIAIAVTACAAYVVIHFAALSAQPSLAALETNEDLVVEPAPERKGLDEVVE